jgi:hypothetical protein
MAIETALRVQLLARHGELARVARVLADAGVNLDAVAGIDTGQMSAVELLVDQMEAAQQALNAAHISAASVPVAVAWLPNRPGSLAHAAEALAAAGINLRSIFIIRTTGDRDQVAFGCAEAAQADAILSRLRETG